MSIFAVPALIALLIKAVIIVLANRGQHTSNLFMGMLAVMAVHNLSEFLVISALFDGNVSELLLRAYYVAASFSLAYLCLFAFETAKFRNSPNDTAVVLITAGIVALIAGGTDLIVVGATSLGYTVTAIKGEYYGAFQLYALVAVSIATLTLLRGLAADKDAETQSASCLILLAVSPIVATTVFVIIAMNLGAAFTGAILFPVAASLFLYIALSTERGHHIIDVRRFLPFSAEKITARKVRGVIESHLQQGKEFKATKDEIERILVEHALDVEKHNVTWAAKRLGIHRTSFYSILKKVGIDTPRSSGDRS